MHLGSSSMALHMLLSFARQLHILIMLVICTILAMQKLKMHCLLHKLSASTPWLKQQAWDCPSCGLCQEVPQILKRSSEGSLAIWKLVSPAALAQHMHMLMATSQLHLLMLKLLNLQGMQLQKLQDRHSHHFLVSLVTNQIIQQTAAERCLTC